MWWEGYCMLNRGHVLSHRVKINNSNHVILFHTSQEWIDLTCFDRYWLSSLWLLSTCLDMVPSDDRLSSKFSIVSFVACGGAICNENELALSVNRYPHWLVLNQAVGFIARLTVWCCITTHKHVPVVLKSCPHVSEAQILPGRVGFPPPPLSLSLLLRRRAVMTRAESDADTVQLSPRGKNFRSSELPHLLLLNAFAFVSRL